MSEGGSGGWRFLALAAVQTLVVGLLAGVLTRLNPYSSGRDSLTRFDPGGSDFAAILSVWTVEAVLALVVVLYVVVPSFVLANVDPVDRRRAALASGAALLGLPLVVLLELSVPAVSLGTMVASLVPFGLSLVITGGGFAVIVAAVVGWKAVAEFGARTGESFPAVVTPLGTVLSLLLLAGLAVGTPAGAAVDDVTFVMGGQHYSPQQLFTYHYEPTDDGRAVLEIHHRGGPSIPADELYIEGDSLVAVDGANQTEAGRWQGSTVAGADGPAVGAGSAVAVGVTEGCEVRVVRRDGTDAGTVGRYECPGA